MAVLNIIKIPIPSSPLGGGPSPTGGGGGHAMDAQRKRETFGKMPIMYLEFIENKSKVKKDVVNKPYLPASTNEASIGDKSKTSDPTATTTLRGDSAQQPEPLSEADLKAAADQGLTVTDSTGQSKTYKYPREETEEQVKERNDVLFQYEVLKRMHPNSTIPEFTTYSDPKLMAQKYDILAKKLSLDSSVENWKRYMIVFVMACEVVLGELNFDMQGFAQQQIISMHTYDSLLVELAEKSYVPTGPKWPVELRLSGLLIINVVIFMVSKIIARRSGLNPLGLINKLTGINKPENILNPPVFPATPTAGHNQGPPQQPPTATATGGSGGGDKDSNRESATSLTSNTWNV